MKMPDTALDPVMFAPCGMNCIVCYRHCDHKKPCAGCLKSDLGKPGHCRKCKIKDCAHEKGLAYCYACDIYPCRLIKNLERSYKTRYRASLMANSAAVRENGLVAFMEQQKAQYTCPDCGGVISIHDAVCSECRKHFK